ncbi:hypothetical protein D3C72_590200 [compost metagenome]
MLLYALLHEGPYLLQVQLAPLEQVGRDDILPGAGAGREGRKRLDALTAPTHYLDALA